MAALSALVRRPGPMAWVCIPHASRQRDDESYRSLLGARWHSARITRVQLDAKRRRTMPEKRRIARARRDNRAGKSATTQAGEFVREENHHVREGKHGARSTKQAIAIGL